MTEEQLRLFFALPLAEELRPPVLEVQRALGRAGAKVKWVEPQNLHFTPKFLGEMPVGVVGRLSETATEVAGRHDAFSLHIAGAGAFPGPADARAIYLGCREGAERLEALATDLDQALATAKLAPREARPFRAHLTIGRNKSPQGAVGLAQAIQEVAGVEIGVMPVSHFVLMRSVLRREGPEYTELARMGMRQRG